MKTGKLKIISGINGKRPWIQEGNANLKQRHKMKTHIRLDTGQKKTSTAFMSKSYHKKQGVTSWTLIEMASEDETGASRPKSWKKKNTS